MLRFVIAQLRGRPRRTLALLAGMLVATTGFTVLSAGTAVQRLRVEGTVDANYRSAYDILVRPTGSRTALEQERGLVQPNYLSGQNGGITLAQVDRIRDVSQVEVAAPIAMMGYAKVSVRQEIDLTDRVDRTAERQLLRLTPTWLADRGLTVLNDAPQYVYLTRNEIIPGLTYPGEYKDGLGGRGIDKCATQLEVMPSGQRVPFCYWPWPDEKSDGRSTLERTVVAPMRLTPDGRFETPVQVGPPQINDRLVVSVMWQVMVLTAAIDPAAEAALVDLDGAVTSGRYLSPAETSTKVPVPATDVDPVGSAPNGIPVLVADTPYVDEQLRVSVERLGADAAAAVPDRAWADWVPAVAAMPGTPTGPPVRSASAPRFDGTDSAAYLNLLYQSGPATYTTDAAGTLHPREVAAPKDLWQYGGVADTPPMLALQEGFRPVVQKGDITTGRPPQIAPVGVFDPRKIRGFSPLSQVSLQTYQAPQAVGADARSRDLLGDKPLLPNSNPGGYLTTPPLILTNLASLGHVRAVAYEKAPVSAVRVRVAGVTGVDDHSRELVRVAAERIATATGLDVDITAGSSPAPQTVALPAGVGGRPALTLSEGWSRKGAAVAIVEAADRKSVLLFGLILVVCALFLGNAVTAAVRDRRRELAVLACVGWPARRLAGAVATEVVFVGLMAGVLGAGTALGVSRIAGVPISAAHAALAIPVGLGVALLAAAPPALAAARDRPGAAVRPAALTTGRARRGRGIPGLALANLWRVPGRTALGVTALAVGVGALTMLVVIALAFRNDVVGSLLGDEVAVRVRGVDLAAAITAIVLGVLIVADVLYINVRERAAELASLWAAGWSNAALLRLVGYEGVGLGVLGGVLGAGLGLAGVAVFTGQLTAGMAGLAALVAAGAVVVAALAAVVPALALRRLPLSTLLAEE